MIKISVYDSLIDSNKAARQGCQASLPGKAARQGCRERLHAMVQYAESVPAALTALWESQQNILLV
jgi:hypothetical protein